MKRSELLERLQGIEWDDFEVKAAAGGVPEDAYKTVSAFANSSGGWIVFGVSEADGGFRVNGVGDPDRLQSDFLSTCRSPEKFSRPVDVLPHHHVVEGVHVLAFHIGQASRFDKPVRVRIRKQWKSFIRLGSGDHECSDVEEARFLRDAPRFVGFDRLFRSDYR